MREVGTVEGEEEAGGADDEEQGDVEDARLAAHHHPPVAVKSILPREHFPLSRHFLRHFVTCRFIDQLLSNLVIYSFPLFILKSICTTFEQSLLNTITIMSSLRCLLTYININTY